MFGRGPNLKESSSKGGRRSAAGKKRVGDAFANPQLPVAPGTKLTAGEEIAKALLYGPDGKSHAIPVPPHRVVAALKAKSGRAA